jgi:hypothetical protein
MTCMCLYQPSFIWLQLSCQMSCCCRSLYLLQESWKRTGPGSAPTTLYGCAPGSIGRQQSARANAYIRAGTARQTQMAIWRMATLVLMSSRWALLESNGCGLCSAFAVAAVQCSAVQCSAVQCSGLHCLCRRECNVTESDKLQHLPLAGLQSMTAATFAAPKSMREHCT